VFDQLHLPVFSKSIDQGFSAAGDRWRDTRNARKDVSRASPALKPEFWSKP
jgi:hypothetical protein